jgi:hypothetical protein
VARRRYIASISATSPSESERIECAAVTRPPSRRRRWKQAEQYTLRPGLAAKGTTVFAARAADHNRAHLLKLAEARSNDGHSTLRLA